MSADALKTSISKHELSVEDKRIIITSKTDHVVTLRQLKIACLLSKVVIK